MSDTPQMLQPLVIQHNNERTPRPGRRLLTAKYVPGYLYETIVREFSKHQELLLMDCKASSSQHWHISETTWLSEVDYAQRSEQAPTKKHTGHVDSYEFNREMVSNHTKFHTTRACKFYYQMASVMAIEQNLINVLHLWIEGFFLNQAKLRYNYIGIFFHWAPRSSATTSFVLQNILYHFWDLIIHPKTPFASF